MNIKLYSSYGCPRCSHMKKVLSELDVEYEELGIDRDPKYRKELDEKMGDSDRIPVLEKDGEIIHIGYGSQSKIKKKLGKIN